MAGPDIRIDALDVDGARREQPSLVALLRNVVDDGGSVGFLPPLSEEDAREYWEGVAAAVKGGGRLLWVAREAHGAGAGRVVGTVQLDLERRANGSHRAELIKMAAGIEKAFSCEGHIIVERFEPGVEVTVAVLGNDDPIALPTLEIVPEHEFYDYESKYLPGMSRHIIPARVSDEARAECARLALAAHRAIGCEGISRSDTIVAEDGTVYLLEVNTIPGMTATSLVPDAARAAGIEFPDLCSRLVALALESWARRRA